MTERVERRLLDLKARQEAEASLNESTEELRQTLQQTITTLNTQIDKAEAMLANLNDQRGKLQSMLEKMRIGII